MQGGAANPFNDNGETSMVSMTGPPCTLDTAVPRHHAEILLTLLVPISETSANIWSSAFL